MPAHRQGPSVVSRTKGDYLVVTHNQWSDYIELAASMRRDACEAALVRGTCVEERGAAEVHL